jgi:hypothetical protein
MEPKGEGARKREGAKNGRELKWAPGIVGAKNELLK